MVNLSQEVSINIINEIVKIVPYLDVDIQKQIELRNKIEEQLNDYEITSKCTELSRCDILDKAFIFLACKKLEGMADSTRYNYTLLFKKMASYFNQQIVSITTIDLRLFLASEYKGNQPNSINDKINKIKAFFTWLQDEGYILKNPSKNLVPTKEPYRKRLPIPELELEKMKEACNTLREKSMLELILTSGIRVSEASNALISKVDWQENSLTVVGKGNKERIVYFSTRARMLLMDYINERQEKGIMSDYIFVASKYPHNNLGRRSIERDVKSIAEKANVDINVFPHKLRTSYVCHGINGGISLSVMQKLAGHSSPATTQLYLTLNDNFVKQEYKKIAL